MEYVRQRPGICGMGSHWIGRPVRRTVQIPYEETVYELNRSEIQVSLSHLPVWLQLSSFCEAFVSA